MVLDISVSFPGMGEAETVLGVEKLLTVRQVAEILGESRRTIRRRLFLAKSEPGSVPHFELSPVAGKRSRPRFRVSEINKWIEWGFPSVEDLSDSKG